MTAIYNYTIRNQLKLKLETLHALPELFDFADLESLASYILNLIKQYALNPELSACGQHRFYKSTSDSVGDFYNTRFYAKKSWFEKIKYFFGFVPENEKSLYSLMGNLKKQIKINAQHYDANWLRTKFLTRTLLDYLINKWFLSEKKEKDLRYISHRIMGTVHFDNKALNGNSTINSIKDYKNDLKTFLEGNTATLSESEKHEIESAIESLNRSQNMSITQTLHGLFEKLKLGKEFENNRIEDAAFLLAEQVHALQKGEATVFPYGFLTNSGGHATLIEIARVGDDLDAECFLVKIFNTGAGSNDIEKLSSSVFSSLFGSSSEKPVRCAKLTMDFLADGSFMRDICTSSYTTFTTLGAAVKAMNAPIKQLDLEDSDEKYTQQTNGTCTHACFDAWFSTKLSKKTFAAFQLAVVNNANHELDNVLQKRMAGDAPKQKEDLSQEQWDMLQKAGELMQARLKEQVTQYVTSDTMSYQSALEKLNNLRSKKNKPELKEADDLQAYAKKKMFRKFNEEDKQYALGQINSAENQGFFGLFFSSGSASSYKPTDRAKKARLALQVAEAQKGAALVKTVLNEVPKHLRSAEAIESEISQLQWDEVFNAVDQRK